MMSREENTLIRVSYRIEQATWWLNQSPDAPTGFDLLMVGLHLKAANALLKEDAPTEEAAA